ncbi:PREDICTED: uncharacterized protein LOC105972862 [Erythranthe guttata]|uniref:uncharacterized protein LOC105972862 n=1 Tax=Erythranthe guttata TaxID=4155 RepID=UPI00064DB567|nr:PREDICTED: uncharacterized protein LOC105972862 [Erythranthe guttata]|eukprot:XP_012853296.1 PREDICTED: uncharacterized protein LOC105972862 [Erythranthe guttata]
MEPENNDMVVYEGGEHNKQPRGLMEDYSDEFSTEQIFETREALLEWVKGVGRRHGMVINTFVSNPGLKGRRRPYVILTCERAGEYRGKKKAGEDDQGEGKRRTGSKKCNCTFRLKGTKQGKDTDNVGWDLKVQCGTHTHTDFENLHVHSYAGRLTKEEMVLVEGMSKAMAKPKAILKSLKIRDERNVTGMRTIYNYRQKLQLKERLGRTQMQELFARLSKDKCTFYHRVNNNKEVIDMVWTHPSCVKLARSYPYVFIMDCTYKTNRYKLPLLEIVGFTCTHKTFSIAFAYLEYEKTENYVWALQSLEKILGNCPPPNCIVTDRELSLMKAIGDVYPTSHHLLCRWHVNKNIYSTCKAMFSSEKLWNQFNRDWATLIEVESEEIFNRDWEKMQRTFVDYPDAIAYLTKSWLDPYKERLVSAWTKKYQHFGTYTSNRAEGAHSRLKSDMGNCLGTFVQVYEHINSSIMTQHDHIRASFEKSKNTYLHCFKKPIYSELRGAVSQCALDHLKIELDKAQKLLPNSDMLCECAIRATHDLPCYHELREFVKKKSHVPLELVGSIWKHMSMEPVIGQGELPNDDELMKGWHKRFASADVDERNEMLTSSAKLYILNEHLQWSHRKRPPLELEGVTWVYPKISRPMKVDLMPSQESAKPILLRKLPGRKVNGKALFLDQIYPMFQTYVKSIKNVDSDGHCGFRAVASMMGFGEKNWNRVRGDMLNELYKNEAIYLKMHRRRENIFALETRLCCLEKYATREYWMSLPDMGHIIGSTYNIVLVYLAPQQCLTFLPLNSEPLPSDKIREHGLAYVNNNHFVHVVLKKNCHIPPIADYWRRYHDEKADGWKTSDMESRITMFRKLVGQEVALQETFIDLTYASEDEMVKDFP